MNAQYNLFKLSVINFRKLLVSEDLFCCAVAMMFNIMALKILAMTQIILVRSENDKIYQVKTSEENSTIENDGNTTVSLENGFRKLNHSATQIL